MGRGLFSGVLWGTALSVMVLWLLSQTSGVVGLVSEPPSDVAVVAPGVGSQGTNAGVIDSPVAPNRQASPSTNPSRQGTVLGGGNTDVAPFADTVSVAVPDAANVASQQNSPQADDAPDLKIAGDVQSIAEPVADAPRAPVVEVAPQAVAAVPAPLAPVVEPVEVTAPQSPEITQQDAPTAVAQNNGPVVISEPVQPSSPVAEVVPENDFSAPTVVATPEPVEVAENTAEETVVAAAPAVSTPVVVNRGGDTGPDEVVAQTEAEENPTAGPAIEEYAREFENPDGRPLMAILLLPTEENDGEVSAVLPFPVSYVVDASLASATERMRQIRDGGNEVAMLTPLPDGATPRDVEVAFQTYMAAVPEAVAVMDVPDAAFQSGRAVATQIAEALAASGHGMVTYSRGLNSGIQVAERNGVPVALVFRVLDGNDRDGPAIRRFLDQAAFRAGQQAGVILVGRDRSETTLAILDWALSNRAGTVALAPLSAVLLAQ